MGYLSLQIYVERENVLPHYYTTNHDCLDNSHIRQNPRYQRLL
jgi:hypothetical protein